MQKQVQRLTANLDALLNSPSKKQTVWLQMELILLGQRREAIDCSLAPLTHAVSRLLAHTDPELARIGLGVFVKLFCLRPDWLANFCREELLESGEGVYYLNTGALTGRLNAALVAQLKQFSRGIDCSKQSLLLVDLHALEGGAEQAVKVLDCASKTYTALLKAVDAAGPCLVGLVRPAEVQATPAKSVKIAAALSDEKHKVRSMNTASTSQGKYTPEQARLKQPTPLKRPKQNPLIQRSLQYSPAPSRGSDCLSPRETCAFAPYLCPLPAYTINIYNLHRGSPASKRRQLEELFSVEDRVLGRGKSRQPRLRTTRPKPNRSAAKDAPPKTARGYNVYRHPTTDKEPSPLQRLLFSERRRKRFAC